MPHLSVWWIHTTFVLSAFVWKLPSPDLQKLSTDAITAQSTTSTAPGQNHCRMQCAQLRVYSVFQCEYVGDLIAWMDEWMDGWMDGWMDSVQGPREPTMVVWITEHFLLRQRPVVLQWLWPEAVVVMIGAMVAPAGSCCWGWHRRLFSSTYERASVNKNPHNSCVGHDHSHHGRILPTRPYLCTTWCPPAKCRRNLCPRDHRIVLSKSRLCRNNWFCRYSYGHIGGILAKIRKWVRVVIEIMACCAYNMPWCE